MGLAASVGIRDGLGGKSEVLVPPALPGWDLGAVQGRTPHPGGRRGAKRLVPSPLGEKHLTGSCSLPPGSLPSPALLRGSLFSRLVIAPAALAVLDTRRWVGIQPTAICLQRLASQRCCSGLHRGLKPARSGWPWVFFSFFSRRLPPPDPLRLFAGVTAIERRAGGGCACAHTGGGGSGCSVVPGS